VARTIAVVDPVFSNFEDLFSVIALDGFSAFARCDLPIAF
jgi:hypothetical protein